MEKDKELGRLLESRLKHALSDAENSRREILRPNRGRASGCISGESKEDVSQLVQRIKNILTPKADAAEQKVALSFGTIFQNFEGLKSSYSNARNLHEQKFMRDWHSAVDVSLISEQLAHRISNLCLEIRSGSIKDVKAAIEQMKTEFLHQNVN